MTRGYPTIDRFPVWFYNLPPANWLEPAKEQERPPFVTVAVDLHGFLQSDRAGAFRVRVGEDVAMTATIDGAAIDGAALGERREPASRHPRDRALGDDEGRALGAAAGMGRPPSSGDRLRRR